jgi:dihydrofolate reductase
MKISLIVAAAENRCIGVNNALPWYLPEDLKYFKRMTMDKPIIIGRKTFESIGKPLPGRTNIVITRDGDRFKSAPGIEVATSLDDALKIAEAIAAIDGKEEVMVIGGAGIYELFLPRADRLYYTRVQVSVNGDAFFPDVNWKEWKVVSIEDHKASGNNPYDYRFCVYDKK